MEIKELKPILESLIFAAEEPLSLNAMTLVLAESGADKNQVKTALEELARDYNDNAEKGLLLREVGGGFQFVTKPATASWVQKLNAAKPRTLSQPSLETLAIIAYRQPIVRSEVEAIRGVDSGGVLKTLLERGLIRILGRREEAGQPLIYGTTPAFMELFHLNSLEELPSMKEIEELVENQKRETASDAEGDGATLPETAGAWAEAAGVDSGEEGISLVAGEVVDDTATLTELEESLKGLRSLEKEIFPKEESLPEAPQTETAPAAPDPPQEPEL